MKVYVIQDCEINVYVTADLDKAKQHVQKSCYITFIDIWEDDKMTGYLAYDGTNHTWKTYDNT